MKDILDMIATAIKGTEFSGRTFIVGGYVRDYIRGEKSFDIDIAVEMPDGARKLSEFLYRKGLSSHPVYFARFGTSYIDINGHKIEFVMTRSESYQERSRKPEVSSAPILDDVYRRDFTINSLIMDIEKREIIDLTGRGISDIEAKLIRATSDPEIIFGEDPLRMLRAVRFAVQLGFEIESRTADGIRCNAARLENISWERRRDELTKMLLTADPIRAFRLMFDYGLIRNVIPELENMAQLEQNRYHDSDALEHTFRVLHNTKSDLKLRLAALLHDIAKPDTHIVNDSGIHFYGHHERGAQITQKVLRRLRYPGSLRDEVTQLVRYHMYLKKAGETAEIITDKSLRKLILLLGPLLDTFLELVHADNLAHAPEYRLQNQVPALKKRIKELRKKIDRVPLPVNGKDIKDYFGIGEGVEVGAILRHAEEIWLENPDWGKEKILQNLFFKEDKMQKEESKVTQVTREAVKKAYDMGEDVFKALSKITKEIVVTAKDEDLSSKEKVQKLAKEAYEGAKQGARNVQPDAEEFVKKASKAIMEAIKVAAPKVAHFTQDAFKGIYEGAKDVYESKKDVREGCNKKEKKEEE
ncbi:MAG: HD domain-containing protein [Candidatus Cloacimonetes bacterium]|nr:HD domain-containing protein [Candidatus Cloacimonadota bacterium]